MMRWLVWGFLLLATCAWADGINNPVLKGNGLGTSEGINNLGMGGQPSPPGSCSGVIDLSTGCIQPMLKGF